MIDYNFVHMDLTEFLWILSFVIALFVNIWALVVAIQDYCATTAPHFREKRILALGAIRLNTLRIIISVAFLYPGILAALIPFGGSAREYFGILGELVIPMFILAAIAQCINVVMDTVDRRRIGI
jgi:hypothetical protein